MFIFYLERKTPKLKSALKNKKNYKITSAYLNEENFTESFSPEMNKQIKLKIKQSDDSIGLSQGYVKT